MSQQYTSPQANERVATGETYEMSQAQEPNSAQRSNRSQASTLTPGRRALMREPLARGGHSNPERCHSNGEQVATAGSRGPS